MNLRATPDLTFDDVLLVPRRSTVRSRGDVSTATRLTRGIRMEIPIVSANMDTVTEWQMAVATARAGGIGIIHRFMTPETPEREAEEVRRAKRAEGHIVESPCTLPPGATAGEARAEMARRGIGSFVVVDGDGRLLGLATRRDLQFAEDADTVGSLMTPAARVITAPAGTGLDAARRILREHRIEKLPLVDRENRVAGLITAKDVLRTLQHPQATKDVKGRLRVGAAVGVRAGFLERAAQLVNAGVVVLRNNRRTKVSRGMASLGAAMERPDRQPEDGEDPAWTRVVAEGVEAAVPYRGAVDDLLAQLVGGLRSGLSYGGARTIRELQETAEFLRITPAGVQESGAHDVDVL